MKVGQRKITLARASALCWMAAAALVQIDVGRKLIAHVSNLHRCGSPWCCPVCSPVVRERRAQEIDQGVGRWLADGHGAVFVTLTLRHYVADALAPRLDVIGQAFRWTLCGAPWDRRKRAWGFVGLIRAVEVTYGWNGWHPHVHAVLLFDRPLGLGEVGDLETWLYGRWSAVVKRRGFGLIDRAHGVDVQAVGEAGDLAGYMAKVDGGWGLGLELARGDRKRGGKGLSPFEILSAAVIDGEAWALPLWLEFEAATFGKRAIVWSPGLRERLGVDAEQSDEALAASEGADLTIVRALVESTKWNEIVRSGRVADLLERIETSAGLVMALCVLMGHEPIPLEGS